MSRLAEVGGLKVHPSATTDVMTAYLLILDKAVEAVLPIIDKMNFKGEHIDKMHTFFELLKTREDTDKTLDALVAEYKHLAKPT